MTYRCMECGAEVEYDEIVRNDLRCKHCSVKRSNIWVKMRPPIKKIVDAK